MGDATNWEQIGRYLAARGVSETDLTTMLRDASGDVERGAVRLGYWAERRERAARERRCDQPTPFERDCADRERFAYGWR